MDTKSKHHYVYSLSAHHVDEVFERLERAGRAAAGPRILYCDTEGSCIFDQQDKTYLDVLADILNAEAGGRKRLRQLLFREQQMIAVWEEKQEVD